MKTQRLAALATGLCLIGALHSVPAWAADAQTPAKAPDTATDNTLIATVNGQALPLDLFRLFFFERLREQQAENSPAFQEQAFNEFVNLVVAAQEGKRRQLDERADVRNALELQKLRIMSNVAMQAILQDKPISDEDLKQAYDKFITGADRIEYKTRTIMVKEEDEAKKLIAQLDKGAKFSELAKKQSLGATAKTGGELDWLGADQMAKPFAAAVLELKPKTYTKKPVHTEYGWHVILLEETRKAQPPSFEEAKPQLTVALQRQRLTDAITELRKTTTVSLNTDVVKLKEEKQDKPKAP